ncbi:hypothetical protein H6G89_08405 [Oscillatoria sp. FACHB-1407]|uniref:hypothetical protein n=1 Tax=Oscillatoria sp. FACHB-1407 TaxID=2692847 RepID=UPI001687D76E|nr:hypothetical protein [Oscillatoria sp. FACHB-1407]MBD2461061.1 hypothetical protein [Oscillatoria sp. FACHB-1407]
MYDNKVRLSQDVIEKAEQIAAEWGLKNARAAVEAVFRRYSDEYLHGRDRFDENPSRFPGTGAIVQHVQTTAQQWTQNGCEALDALDDLLAM